MPSTIHMVYTPRVYPRRARDRGVPQVAPTAWRTPRSRESKRHGGAGSHRRRGYPGRVDARPPYRASAAALVLTMAVGGCSFGQPKPDEAGEPPKFPTPSATATPRNGNDQQVAATVLAKG